MIEYKTSIGSTYINVIFINNNTKKTIIAHLMYTLVPSKEY